MNRKIMPDIIGTDLPRFAQILLSVKWFAHSHEIPEDAKSDLVSGIGEAIHAFGQQSEQNASRTIAERFSQDLSRKCNFTTEEIGGVFVAFDLQWEPAFRKKIRSSIPMSLHTKSVSDEFIFRLRHGLLADVFTDVASGTFFRVWCDWLRRGHFACFWDGDLDDPMFDDVFVLMNEYRQA
ncbi:hypothetical protein [Rubinisphaera margarita]|uniref:hypothetical protein n=1 Tax=Rubinisphaera margarita TaxID=2909586 RepID=UPI001EE95000|nr:hypothetical protein [Rubinisphaera margarita]MCG6154623.1 hypothetical protein [Rubinisphaera margarita]